MNTTRRNPIRRTSGRAAGSSASRRRGSVLVVVLALLSALMLLGFLFYTSASQERANARYFAASEKFYDLGSNPNPFDFPLEQIILGPRDDYANSVLWGGRYSLLASMVGSDVVPYNGTGVNLVDAGVLGGGSANGIPAIDQDHDGAADITVVPAQVDVDGDGFDDRLAINMAEWSVAAAAGTYPSMATVLPHGALHPTSGMPQPNGLPQPDVGYSYPDLNSLFLSYEGTEPMFGQKVIIPSFHRPQYLRGFPITQDQWYINPITSPYTLRPHQARPLLYFDPATGTIVDTGFTRFDTSFWGTTDTTVTTNPSEGYWDRTLTGTGEPITEYDVNADNDRLDVDGDGPDDGDGDGIGDGTKEAILLDLGHPVAETPDGSLQYIPMYSATIRETNSLLNLNAHGNLFNIPDDLTNPPTNPGTNSPFISASNQGRHRHEVNPIYGFTAGDSEKTGNEPTFFGYAGGVITPVQLANIEFWFTMVGRAEIDAGTTGDGDETIAKSIPGRWGERNILENAILNGNTSDGTVYGNSAASMYPRAGKSGQDDPGGNYGDQWRGMLHAAPTAPPAATIFPTTLRFLASVHPEDHQGQGTFADLNGRTMKLVNLLVPGGPRIKVPAYLNYWYPDPTGNGASTALSDRGPTWMVEQIANGWPTANAIATLATFGIRGANGLLVDNPGETILDPEQSSPEDSIFGPGEVAALHMSDLDFSNANMTSRLIELVPANFEELERRQRFTTISRDLKSYSYPLDPYSPRAWETRSTPAMVAFPDPHVHDFPPYYGAAGSPIDVFRPAARAILQQSQSPLRGGGNANQYKGLVRKLSVNQVAALAPQIGDATPEYVLRPLTPHPQVATTQGGHELTRDAIPTPAVVGGTGQSVFGVSDQVLVNNALATWNIDAPPASFTSVQLQEWHARRDRQNMARDIFTLLYTFSHVDPTINVTTTSNVRATPTTPGSRPIYTDAQLREMAQFAVNVVDAMDPDDTITLFVYDKDLAGVDGAGYEGYTHKDDGYSDPPPYVNDLTDYSYDPANGAGFYEDADRGMVFGVEAQQLAFSEVLAVLAKKYFEDSGDDSTLDDHMATQWDDTQNRDFVYVELQNMTPWEVSLSGGWSIVCDPFEAGYAGTGMTARSLTILSDDDSTNDAVVNAGSVYTIGTAGDSHLTDAANLPTGLAPSFMEVDPDADASATMPTYTRIAPAAGDLDFDGILAESDTDDVNLNAFNEAEPWTDGIKIIDNHGDPLPSTATPPNPKGSAWLDLGTQAERDGLGATVSITFTLRRRVNLHREFPIQDPADPDDAEDQRDNPWVVVDVHEVPLSVFDLSDTTAATDVQTALTNNIISEKRPEPLDRTNVLTNSRNIDTYQTNSLGGYHPDDIDPANIATIWHRHFDRSFASLADLLLVPLYGPKVLTADITTASVQPAVNDPKSVAAARFLYPDGDIRDLSSSQITADKDAGTPGKQIWDKNLWYRLFEFVEVPDKYGNPDDLPWFYDYAGVSAWDANENRPPNLRRFGKININMLRHPHVLAGLLDDPRVIDHSDLFNGGSALFLPSTSIARDWWQSLLISRDGGADPYTNNHYGQILVLPGVPTAEPFRSFSVAPTSAAVPTEAQIHNTFAQTFLRPMVDDQPTPYTSYEPGRRALFELGSKGSVFGSELDPDGNGAFENLATRYRLLGKVLKHGTTRSNTYVIFMTCDYYEAREQTFTVPSGGTASVYQIGEKIPADSGTPEKPRYRGVFVVDRTLALQMLEARDMPQRTQYPPAPSHYRTFSYARNASSGSPQPTFDWKELVIYSKIITAP